MPLDPSVCNRYWGKTSRGHPPSWHSLGCHLLDVAAVAATWLDMDGPLLDTFARASGATEVELRAWVPFFAALHDLGKFDVRFQLKAPELFYQMNPGAKDCVDTGESRGFSHVDAGFAWFLEEGGDYGFASEEDDVVLPWVRAICAHHGQTPHAGPMRAPLADPGVVEQDRSARRAWVAAMRDLFLVPAGLGPADLPPTCPNLFAGFCSVCDWVGSNNAQGWFEFENQPCLPDAAAYLQRRCRSARMCLAAAGMVAGPPAAGGMAALFPGLVPRCLQAEVDAWPLKPGLVVVEAPTGSGKTEIALAHAARLMAAGFVQGIVFALPTQATANAMLARLDRVATRLYPGTVNIVLAHGKARHHPLFKSILESARDRREDGADNAVAQCASWLAESRKRIFLGQIGVCTIDQVLLSVLPVRHYFVRGFGLRRNILVVDEVHAYDRYMNGLLDRVLEAQREAGGSAILLSATLPAKRREEILAQWDGRLSTRPATDYPLASFATRGGTEVSPALTAETPGRTVGLRLDASQDMLPAAGLLADACRRAADGARVAVVCNLVDAAQATWRALRELSSVPVQLFHARLRFIDRQHIEQAVMAEFGPGRASAVPGRILVATQVIEQSLDLDFDWLITQLCPVDLLFQRLGRLHRHARPRPACAMQAECLVVVPPPGEPDYGRHLAIYNDPLTLWRTEQLVRRHDCIGFPAAYRSWIEAVYSDQPWSDEPAAVREGHEEFHVQELVRRSNALRMAVPDACVELWKDTDDKAARLTRDGEMSCRVVPVTIVRGEPCFLDSDRPLRDYEEWDLAEQRDLQTVPVPHSWRKNLPGPSDGVHYLPMVPCADGAWEAEYAGTGFAYSRTCGLWRK